MGSTEATVRTHHHQKEGVHMRYVTRMGIDLAKHVFQLLLVLNDAAAAPDSNFAQPTSLCTPEEVVLFSAAIGDKKVSLCGTTEGMNSRLLVQYRFGQVGRTPELEYPSKAAELSSAFDVGTTDNTSGFPLQTISFKRPGAAYDIMTPDESDYVRWAPFTGVGVTVQGKPTQLLKGEEGSVIVNLAPVRKALGLAADASLSESLPKYSLDEKPYPMVCKALPCGSDCRCDIEYPKIRGATVAAEIRSFTEKFNCEGDGNYHGGKVTASIIRGSYLVLSFSYHAGWTTVSTKLFHKTKTGWKPLKKEDVLDSTPKCQGKINSLLYRQLKPQLSNLDSQERLLDSADIAIRTQGLSFSYDPYQLGSYAEGPWPVLLSYKMLDGCLRLDH
jgi:hypothetical protein